ncbi:MAG TPA: integrase arm-type DNA-binding domain-containing protein [Stellaceae bacterium]|nr:integrase arm-type DNA-binding domain-containing protein [Stellaceae bacterium]
MILGKLKALTVERVKAPGMLGDGGGLYLQITERGVDENDKPIVAKSWLFRFRLHGHTSKTGKPTSREMGLGPFPDVTLEEARGKAMDCRRLCREGVDPIDARNAARARAALEAVQAMTFKHCIKGYIKSHREGWRNSKHAGQWESTLSTYAEPLIGALPVRSIETGHVMKVLEQEVRTGDDKIASLWSAKTETASRLRGRIESVLDWAKVRGYREGENPARWRGHLDQLLPSRAKVQKIQHHAALPYDNLPDFMVALQAQEGVGARALEFAILTAARTGEVIGAQWAEIDLTEKIWIVPATRMKAAKQHRVPLSARALEILEGIDPVAASERQNDVNSFVFPGRKPGEPLSNMAFLMLLRRMDRGDLTAHGFRSSFRDWAAERTSFPNDVAEMALAHTVSGKVEAAYRRGDLFERRRRIMADWATFCVTPKLT